MIDLTRDVELRAQVCAKVKLCVAIAEAHYGRSFLQPFVTFNLKRRAAGMAVLREVRIEINMDVLRADPEHVINVTAGHEVAHHVHYQMRPEDYRKGTREHHGRHWQAVMRALGIADPMRVYKPSADVAAQLATTQRRVPRLQLYRCPGCGSSVQVGPRYHGKLQRGAVMRHIQCGVRFNRTDHVGLHPKTIAALEARR